jgi:hypothetical protein
MSCRAIPPRRGITLVLGVAALVVGAVAVAGGLAQTPAPPASEARDMDLVGQHDLQGRPAYQPVIHNQAGRWIAYVGHHGGQATNPLTGRTEWNGTSIVDVSDPRNPDYLAHIPGAPGGSESAGAPMVRVCEGSDLPRGRPGRTYMLRTRGSEAHEVWDVSDPRQARLTTTVLDGLGETHKSWWECKSGIAYLVSDGRPSGWRTSRMTKIYDLGDPAAPRFIRDFGLAGQEPGSTGPVPAGLHGPIALGGRLYLAYGTGADGVLQIVDRDRLIRGDASVGDRFAPTPGNLLYPQLGRLDMPPAWGGHTAFPVLGIPVPDWAAGGREQVRDFVVLVSESLREDCQETRHLAFLVDVTTESRPFPVASFQVPAASGDFCRRGGRFGPHSTNESFTRAFYGRLVFLAYFNAGVRAVDIRDPYHPREVAFFIPASTANTRRRCTTVSGADRCRAVVQTNNVEVDDRGLVYLADRAGTGLHIVELTGAARAIARLP